MHFSVSMQFMCSHLAGCCCVSASKRKIEKYEEEQQQKQQNNNNNINTHSNCWEFILPSTIYSIRAHTFMQVYAHATTDLSLCTCNISVLHIYAITCWNMLLGLQLVNSIFSSEFVVDLISLNVCDVCVRVCASTWYAAEAYSFQVYFVVGSSST